MGQSDTSKRWTLEKRPSGWFVLRGRATYHEVVEVMPVAEHKAVLRRIAGHFVDLPDGEVRTYAGPVSTLDLIRQEVQEVLNA